MALVVHACDRYQILFQGFEHFFRQYWPDLAGVNLYFLTEVIDHPSARFTNLKTGKGEWSDRLRVGLQQLAEPFVIYLQEDMWFNRPVNISVLTEVLDYAVAEKLPLLKLHSSEVYHTHSAGKIIGGLQLARLDNRASKYLMSHQPSIWNREFLISQLSKNEHPWRNERKGTKRLKYLNLPLYQIDLLAENGKPAINENVSVEFRSEYQSISVNGMLHDNALPFIEELMKSSDQEASVYGRRLQHNFANRLTHDGLPKPKKAGFMKTFFSFS